MKSIVKLYTAEMRKKYGNVYAAWKPGSHYELGDYGVLKGYVFEYHGNIRQLGLDFDIIADSTPSNENYRSSGVSATKIAADGGAVVLEGVNTAAGFNIEFSNQNSVLYEALNVHTNKIADVAKLGKQLIDMYESDTPGANGVEWVKDYVVITEIDAADSATIIISNTRNAKIELRATANIGATNMNIADPKLGWSIATEHGLESRIVADAGATPLFKVKGIRGGSLFSKSKFKVRSNVKKELDFVNITGPDGDL